MTRHRRQRPGYVLVLTLGLVTLAAISLSGFARYSLEMASRANEATEELQHRWGLLTARHVLMNQPAELIASQVRPEEASGPPWPKPASVSTAFSLGSLKFTVNLADEDSKVNLNTVRARHPDLIPAVIRRQCGGTGGLRLLPTAVSSIGTAYRSWGEVFDLAASPRESKPCERLPLIGRTVTCWGSGRLNLCRASDAAVGEIASLALSPDEVGSLVSHRKNWNGQSIDELLGQLSLRRPELLAIGRLLNNDSRSYSLWVEVANGKRLWSYQYVMDNELVCFAW